MNIYEDEQLQKKLNELTDQLGHLFLDMLLISLKKVNHENILFKDFEDSRNFPDEEDFLF
ncbi:MAG: hypothetical protein GAS50_04530 [Desulfobacterales bacterium]|jgi:ATP-dependent RNA circularization protein (DNA/RNA ligase family)|nr:hypothetical protein [Desulfobacterales bacterium]